MPPARGVLWQACGRAVLWRFVQLETLSVQCTSCRRHASQRCFSSRVRMPGRHALLQLSKLRTSAPRFLAATLPQGSMEECRAAYSEASQWFAFWRSRGGGDVADGEAAIIADKVGRGCLKT